MLIADPDLPSLISPNSIETLDESSSPMASIGAHCVQSLALDDDHVEEISIPPLTSDGPSFDETLIEPSLVSLDRGVPQEAPYEFDDSLLAISLSDNQKRWTPIEYDDSDDECSNGWWNQPLCKLKQEPLKMIVEPTCVGVGLWNLGNSCFVNSVLQCLTHTVSLIEGFCSYKTSDPCNCGNEMFCVITALRGHMESALTSRCSISPFYFFQNLNYFSPDFRCFQQEDAHEFLQAFLDKLERCCFDPSSDLDYVSSQDANLVQRIFGGRLVSELRCCNCDSVSETFENSLGLSLEIEDVGNLQSALDSFTCVEKLEEPMTCDNCKEKVSKEKQLLLDKLPEVVTFHLKRFKNNGYFMEKIFKHVEFPLEIDLQPYMNSSQNSEVTTKYQLYAFVEHLGSLAYGHYFSYVRSAPKTWHQFDDKQVTRIDEERVLSLDSYILFYAREGTRWFSSVFEEMHQMLEARLQNSSPNSVLDPPTNGECLSEISYENVYKPQKRCDDSAGVTGLLHVKPEESSVSLSNEFDEDVLFQSAESSGGDSPMAEEPLELHDPDDDNSNDSCNEKEVDSCSDIERASSGDDFVTYLMVQNQVSAQKQRDETLKNQEEAPCKQQPSLVSDVAESKETEIVHRGLMKKPSPRERVLDQAISISGSPPKKLKTA